MVRFTSSSPLLHVRPDFYEAKWLPLYGRHVAVGQGCIAAYSAVRVLKGQQQIEIISFSPAIGFQTELYATAGERGSKLCLNAQISAVTLFEVLHTDGRSKHMTATITLLYTANMQTHYWLALLSNRMKVSEPPACWAMIWAANISRICQHFSLRLDAHVGNTTSSLARNISCFFRTVACPLFRVNQNGLKYFS